MARRGFLGDDALHAYVARNAPVEDDLLAELGAETAALGGIARMQIGAAQGSLLTMLARLVGARDAVEVGTFTGYSSISIARGLAPGGRLLCCDVSEEWTDVARRYWERAGLTDTISLRLGPATQTLAELPAEPRFDLAFLDADKTGYIDYWELLVPRMRPGGLLVVDNVLQGGRVLDPGDDDEMVRAVFAFNEHVRSDHRVHAVLLPVYDGLTLARVGGDG